MKKDCNESPEIIVPLGRALKDARLAVPLSIDEVAEKLNLSNTAVRDIEDNLNQILETKKYPIIYLRGYLANYAKLVGLSTLELFIEYQQLAVVRKSSNTLPPSQLIIPHPKKRSKLLPFSVFAIVVVGIGFYLTQKPTSTSEQSIAKQTETVQASSASESSVAPIEATSTLNIEVKKQVIDIKLDEQPEVLAAQPIEVVDVIVEQQVETAVVKSVVTTDDVTTAIVPEPVIVSEPVTVSEPVIATPTITQEVVQETVEEVVPEAVVAKKVEVITNTDSLSLSFSAECWTEVVDANGKRVAYGLYKKGRVLELSGVAPFQLKLGDPSVVEIQYNDQLIEGDFTPGRTARFNVPLS